MLGIHTYLASINMIKQHATQPASTAAAAAAAAMTATAVTATAQSSSSSSSGSNSGAIKVAARPDPPVQ